MDWNLSQRLGLIPDFRQVRVAKDHFSPGYFVFLGLAMALAVCLWILLRRFAESPIVREFLRSAAGILALIIAPLAWLYVNGWDHFIELSEIALIVILGSSYAACRRPGMELVATVLLVLHYAFWVYKFGAFFSFGGYYGPLPPAVGLCAGLAWLFYLRKLHIAGSIIPG